MKRILILITALLLVAGCTRKEETDWIIGKWYVVSCTATNISTGKQTDIDPEFKTWEFTQRGKLIVDGDRVLDYWHNDGKVSIESVIYEEVMHGRNRMQLRHNDVYSVTTYTFSR